MHERATPVSAPPTAEEFAALRRDLAAVQSRLDRAIARPRRRTLARFLPLALAALLVALVPLATLAANPFTDLNPGSVHNPNIDAIYNAGITTGCDPTSYCPNGNVTREEMASFLARTAGIGANKPVANAARLATTNPTAGGATYAANELVRVARASQTSGFSAVSAVNTTYLTLSIDAPTTGFVVLTGTLQTKPSNAGCPCTMFYALYNEVGVSTGTYSTYSHQGTEYQSGATTYVFPVAAGTRTFTLRGNRFSGTATIGVDFAVMSAVFIPFGSTGAGSLETPNNTPDDSPTSQH